MLSRSARSMLAAAQPKASAICAFYATRDDASVTDTLKEKMQNSPTMEKMRETVEDATNTDASQPSITEKIREGVGKVTEKVGEMFKETGSVGHQFTPEGTAGGTAQQVGGPFDKEGAVGKQFTTEGSIGGTVERAAETVDEKGEEMQKKAQQNQGKEQMKQQ